MSSKLILVNVPEVVIQVDGGSRELPDSYATIKVKLEEERRTFGHLWWKQEAIIYRTITYKASHLQRQGVKESYEVL